MRFRKRKIVPPRTPAELDAMSEAGAIAALALVAVRNASRPGISTLELDQIAEATIRDHGAIPSFLGYEGFPGSICSSVNDVIVHGIPTATTILREGDLVSIDCGAILHGWHGDTAWTFGIGELSKENHALNLATEEVLMQGMQAMIPGNRLTDVSYALECATDDAEIKYGYNFGIVDGYGGHGIGREMHEEPYLANEGKPGHGPRLEVGSVLAIEPMLTLGTADSEVLSDGWTVKTLDGSNSSHWEHTVVVTENGPRILTQRPLV